MKELSFYNWLTELLTITFDETGNEVSINEDEAYKWYLDGFTPYQTFRETYSNENDSE